VLSSTNWWVPVCILWVNMKTLEKALGPTLTMSPIESLSMVIIDPSTSSTVANEGKHLLPLSELVTLGSSVVLGRVVAFGAVVSVALGEIVAVAFGEAVESGPTVGAGTAVASEELPAGATVVTGEAVVLLLPPATGTTGAPVDSGTAAVVRLAAVVAAATVGAPVPLVGAAGVPAVACAAGMQKLPHVPVGAEMRGAQTTLEEQHGA
jgi:hypothetical protein